MRIPIILAAILFPLMVFNQEIEDFTLFEIIEEIYVDSIDGGFRKEIMVVGSANDEDKWFVVVFGELDKVEIISATWENYKGKEKPIDIDRIYESDLISYSFYSGNKTLNIPIPKTPKFVIKYTLENPHLILLSALWMGYSYPTKKITKEIILPEDLQLHYDLPDVDFIEPVVEETDDESNLKHYIFTSNSVEDKDRDLPAFHYSTIEWPMIRILITKEGETPEYRLNQSVLNLNEPVCQLKENAMKITDSLTKGLTDKMEIAQKCYEFVQQGFNYIDIENGLDAYQPTDVNLTLRKRIGDCKDLAMLLTAMLCYKEVEAFYAIVPANSFSFNMDFPSMASANHVVCALKTNDSYIILDGTDRLCEFGEPSMHTQGETMFIVSENGPVWYEIPVSEAENNRIQMSIELEYDDGLSGICSISLTGKSKDYYKYLMDAATVKNKESYYSHFIELFSGSATKGNLKTVESDSCLVISTRVKINSSYLNEIGGKLYLNPSFMPRPYFFEAVDENVESKIVLPYAFEASVECNINFGDSLMMPDSSFVEFHEGDFSGYFAVGHNDVNQIYISSGFKCNKIEYFHDEIESFRKIKIEFEKLYRHAIKLHQAN